MSDYLVYRHGSNAANQPMTQTMPIGCYDAECAAEAKAKAAEENTVYANQHLSAELAEDCSEEDQIAAQEYQAAESLGPVE